MNSIRFRLLTCLMLPLIIVAVIVAIETFLSSQKIANDLHDKTLFAATLAISENIVASNGTILADEILKVLTETLGDRFFYHVVGPDGSFVTGFSGYPRLPKQVQLEENIPFFYDAVHQNETVRVMAIRQFLSNRQLNGITTITAWQRIEQRDLLALNLFTHSLIRLLLLVLAAGLIVWFAVSRGLSPLHNLEKAISTRTPYDLTPIRRPLPRELKGIAASMNSLFERVAKSKFIRERFIGDAAHQLRNPIAAIKIQAETALVSKDLGERKQELQNIVATTNQTSKLIEQMLMSARMHAMDKEEEEIFDLGQLLQNIGRQMAPYVLSINNEFFLDVCEDDVRIRGQEILLREAIINLIDNSVKHCELGGEIGLHLQLCELAKQVEISVSDHGVPLDQEQLLKYSQPFATGDSERPGSGLGLSLVKDIAKAHGGWLACTPYRSGKKISIILPYES